MPDQRIYYVPPRFLGLIEEWSGANAADGHSWLIDHAASMNFNAIWFSPFFETTGVAKMMNGQLMTGSYYAIRDNLRMDGDYSTGSDDEDKRHWRHFCADAKAKNIRVYADMVCNHVAADHPLVEAESRELRDIFQKTEGKLQYIHGRDHQLIGVQYADGAKNEVYYFKFKRRHDLSLEIPGPANDPWSDVAPINYASPEAMRFFIHGDANQKAYFKEVIDWHLDQGFTGFRCDAAYLIPPDAWQELIQYTHSKLDDVIFMAETLGGPSQMVGALGGARIKDHADKDRPAFDLGMLGIYWWNFEDHGLPFGESSLVQAMSHFGGAGSPDTHDTETTLATALRRMFNRPAGRDTDERLGDAAVRDYAVSVLACASSYMQMGYEFGNEKQNHVFRGQVSPADWKKLKGNQNTPLDIRARIKEIHDLKEQLDVGNCRVKFKELGRVQNGAIMKIHVEYIDVDTNTKKADVVLLLNRQPENGAVLIDDQSIKNLRQQGLHQMCGVAGKSAIRDVMIYHTPVTPPQYKTAAEKRKALHRKNKAMGPN